MQNINNELSPLLPQTNANPSSFFRHTLKATKISGIFAAGIFSGYMYWPSSFQAAKFGGKALQYLAALGGSITNSIFNIESFLNISELPNFRKIPFKYLSAVFVSFFCVLPIFLMNLEDEEGNYLDNTGIMLQGFIASLNILVNVVGTIELIDSTASLWKNKTELEKSRLMAKIERALINFSYLNPEEQTEANFLKIIENNFAKLTIKQKVSNFSLKSSLSIISIPLILAYTLISYFDMKDFAEKKWHTEELESILLGIIAATGNTIPSIGFLLKGLNATCEKLISLEKPSLLSWVFIMPVLFSGFTTHKAMEASLKRLNYFGDFAEILKWTSNLTAALIYNFPQIAALADRLSRKKNTVPETFYHFKTSLHKHIQPMEAIQFREFIEDPSSVPQRASNFFRLPPATIQNDSLIDIEPHQMAESSFSA